MQESYCRKRTKKSLKRIVWALVGFIIALTCGVTFMVRFRSDKTYWEMTDYVSLIVAALLAAAGFLFGLFEFCTGLRDVLFPAKSRLANSIRAQLPGPDTGMGVEELFAIVDRDLSEHGIWFNGDKAAVGQEWVLGEDAVYIPRIRVACGRDDIVTHGTGSRIQSSRVIAFYLLDDRKKAHSTAFHSPDELRAFLDCLKLRAPDIFFCSYQEYLSCRGSSDIEWEKTLREFQHRKNEREFRIMEEERAAYNKMQTAQTAYPNSTAFSNAAKFSDTAYSDAMASSNAAAYSSTTAYSDAAAVSGNAASSWILPEPEEESAQQSMPPCLILIAASGARQYHEMFTREDVEVAAEGLIDGSYRNVELHTRPFCWMVIEGVNGQDGWFRIGATRPDTDKLRYFSAEGTQNQAAMWLTEFYDGCLDMNNPQWKDDTKQMEKKVRKEVRRTGRN